MKSSVRHTILLIYRGREYTRRLNRMLPAGFFLGTLTVAVIILLVTPAWSKTIHVPGDSATIQAGIDGAVDGDTVLVADGIYTGVGNKNLDFLGKAIVVRSENGPEVTVISCGNNGRGAQFHSGEGPCTKLEGFTVRYGKASSGGGIHIEDSSPTISNCIILGNIANWNDGGGLFINRSSSTINNCIIVENVCYRYGGGIRSNYSFLQINNCTIAYNESWGQWWDYDLGDGGAISCDSIIIANSIIWGNERYADGSDGIHCTEYAFITYSDVQGNWLGVGNINVDPLFRDRGSDDFHLQATYCDDLSDSPCIDAGDPDITDQVLDCGHGLGTTRSDMGAYGGGNTGWPTSVVEHNEMSVDLPQDFILNQNFPNPFNVRTEISYQIPRSGIVSLRIYNILGQLVITLTDGSQEAGKHRVIWDASDCSSGIYFARLEVGNFFKTNKMVLLK